MRITQLLGLLLLTRFISGCGFLNVVDDYPETFSNYDLLESLIGQKSESVFKVFGLPYESLQDGDKLFMVYSIRSASIRHEVFLNAYARGKGEILYCLRIELDSDDFVKDYKFKRKTSGAYAHVDSNCRDLFWSKEDLTNLQLRTTQEVLLQPAEQGNAEAQLALFKNLRGKSANEALAWLCRSADSGNQEARSILAKIYEYGGYVWIKNNVVQQNYKLAYVWHGLSGLYDQEDLQFFADRYLTTAELSEAKNLLREWRAGQCERDLGLVSYTE